MPHKLAPAIPAKLCKALCKDPAAWCTARRPEPFYVNGMCGPEDIVFVSTLRSGLRIVIESLSVQHGDRFANRLATQSRFDKRLGMSRPPPRASRGCR